MKLYYLPPSSYSQKVLIAGIEKQVEFELNQVNLFDPDEAAKYREIYPIGKIPLLILEDDHMIPEASIIIEYLDTHFSSGPRLIPQDPDESRQVRFHDRMLDQYLSNSAGSMFFELRKPAEEQNKDQIQNWVRLTNVMFGYIDKTMGDNEWLYGDSFSLVDISAATGLKTASLNGLFDEYPNVQNYYQRLCGRASIAEVFNNAQPFYDKLANQGA